MAITKEQIIRDLIPEELRKNKAIVDIKPDLPLKVKKKIIDEDEEDAKTVSKPIRQVALKVKDKRFNKEEWMKSLKKGDVVAVRPWYLGPAFEIGIVSSVTATMVILSRGRRFDKFSAISVDSNKLMITPLYDKSIKEIKETLRRK